MVYTDGREGSARATLRETTALEGVLREEALAILDRALTRRVRVRRIRLEAWEEAPSAAQLLMWGDEGADPEGAPEARAPRGRGQRPQGSAPPSPQLDRSNALAAALQGIRTRLGADTLIPASWLAHGLVTTTPRRNRRNGP